MSGWDEVDYVVLHISLPFVCIDEYPPPLHDLHHDFSFSVVVGQSVVDFFRDFREQHAGRAGH
jgi:hypothetical protein